MHLSMQRHVYMRAIENPRRGSATSVTINPGLSSLGSNCLDLHSLNLYMKVFFVAFFLNSRKLDFMPVVATMTDSMHMYRILITVNFTLFIL